MPDRARQLLERSRQQAMDVGAQRRLLELVLTTLVYKFPDRSREEIQQMLGLDELKQTRFYQEIAEEERQSMLARTVPLLLDAGLSIEQIAQQLQMDVEAVRRAAQNRQND